MSSVSLQVVKQQNLVVRTYQMGVKFPGTREERRTLEREANQRIKGLQVQQEDIIREKKAVQAALNLARVDYHKNPKFATSEISKVTNNSRNITKSAYSLLFTAAKGAVDRERKAADFFNILLNMPERAIEWFVYGRSPILENYIVKKWEVSRLYVINFIHGLRRQIDKICPPDLKFNKQLPLLSQKEVEKSISICFKKKCRDLTSPELMKKTENFVLILRLLQKNTDVIAPFLTSWINTTHLSRWKSMEKLRDQIAEALGNKNRSLFSALRTIIVFALFPNIGKTVHDLIRRAQPEKLISPPFRRRKKGRIPILLIMKDRLVVMRPGNADHMTFLAKADGEFDLGFLLKDHPRITGKLVFPEKVREYLIRGAKIKCLSIRSELAPGYKIRVYAILEGPEEVFLNYELTKEFLKVINAPKSDFVGLDVNRIGEHMLALSNEVRLPKKFKTLFERFQKLDKKKIPELHFSLTCKAKQKKIISYYKTKGEISRNYKRKRNIVKEIRNLIPHFLAAVMIKSQCKIFFMEDLETDPRGKKGALAKAIRSMPKSRMLFEKATMLASNILGYDVELVTVDQRGTSRYHNKCGGLIDRDPKNHYDRAPCKKCGEKVNTHTNAARNIVEEGLKKLKSQNRSSPHTRSLGTPNKQN
ncbi:MAG: transposase [Candidatus Heimdallarchaeota archaeon]|nr:transposase [Candidatus Heimdallarchaeota archaeon]